MHPYRKHAKVAVSPVAILRLIIGWHGLFCLDTIFTREVKNGMGKGGGGSQREGRMREGVESERKRE